MQSEMEWVLEMSNGGSQHAVIPNVEQVKQVRPGLGTFPLVECWEI